MVDSLVKASPQVLFLLFGRRSILSSATMWETLLYPPLFSRLIDMGLCFLFNWQTKNISAAQKLAAYPHLYSFTSTKSVVHWFQIIRNRSFQMFDDDIHQPMSVSTSNKFSKVAKYPTRNIRTPVVLVYGGSDSLVDIKAMLKELPPQTVATEIPHYEHLDFLWARDVDMQVFQHVFDALDSFTDAEHTKEEYDRYFTVRQESLIGSGAMPGRIHRGSESDTSTIAASNEGADPEVLRHRARERRTSARFAKKGIPLRAPASTDEDASPSSPEASDPPQKVRSEAAQSLDIVLQSGDAPPPTKLKGTSVRRGSGNNIPGKTSVPEDRGLSTGTSKSTGNIVTQNGVYGISSADGGNFAA